MKDIESVGRMAAEILAEDKTESDVIVTLRRMMRDAADVKPLWVATVGDYSSKSKPTPEEAIAEVASMYRSALLARIERAEKRVSRSRTALGESLLPSEGQVKP